MSQLGVGSVGEYDDEVVARFEEAQGGSWKVPIAETDDNAAVAGQKVIQILPRVFKVVRRCPFNESLKLDSSWCLG